MSLHVDKARSLSQYEAAETGYPLEGNAAAQKVLSVIFDLQ